MERQASQEGVQDENGVCTTNGKQGPWREGNPRGRRREARVGSFGLGTISVEGVFLEVNRAMHVVL